MDMEYLLSYFCEKDAVIEFPVNKEIIQKVMSTFADDNHDPNDNYTLSIVATKDAFQGIVTLNIHFL